MAAGAVLLALALSAQTAPAADTGSALIEQVGVYQPKRGDTGDYWRYFFFWKSGVQIEVAQADLSECAGYTQNLVQWGRIPERMPIEGKVTGPNGSEGGFGLIGVGIYSMLEGSLVRRIALANMRRCMGFKGYRRFGLSEALSKALNEGNAEQIIGRLAQIAAGPEPRQESIAP